MSRVISFSSVIWLVLWIFQGMLWLLMVFFTGHYLFVEVPDTRRLYANGLEDGGNGLAGIIAAAAPDWNLVKDVQGHSFGTRLSRFQGDSAFTVWIGKDEYLSWNAGFASLTYDRDGTLLWVRRLSSQDGTGSFVRNLKSGELIPVIETVIWPDNKAVDAGFSVVPDSIVDFAAPPHSDSEQQSPSSGGNS